MTHLDKNFDDYFCLISAILIQAWHLRVKTIVDSTSQKGGGVAELVAHLPTDPKVRGLNHRAPEYS